MIRYYFIIALQLFFCFSISNNTYSQKFIHSNGSFEKVYKDWVEISNGGQIFKFYESGADGFFYYLKDKTRGTELQIPVLGGWANIKSGEYTTIVRDEKDSVTGTTSSKKIEGGGSIWNKLYFLTIIQDIKIGSQIWSANNLSISTFANGDVIFEAKTIEEWVKAGKQKIPAWCYYNNEPKNGSTYGKLYNWYAVIDPRGLAPAGYHIPTDAEWSILTDFLGGEIGAADKMKTIIGWPAELSTVANNSSSFSALPGGSRDENGIFSNGGIKGFGGILGYWWSSTKSTDGNSFAWGRKIGYRESNVESFYYSKKNGYSVRCLKN